MLKHISFKTKEEWLEFRLQGISATDVGALLGMGSFGKTKMDVYMKCVHHKEKKIDENSEVLLRGQMLEPLVRKSFMVDYSDIYQVKEPPKKGNWVWFDTNMDYFRGSLDGYLIRKQDGKKSVLEIKTVDVMRQADLQLWESGELPNQYYCQVLSYLAITGWMFAVLRARIRAYEYNGKEKKLSQIITKDYYITTEDKKVRDEVRYVKKVVKDFWENNVLKKMVPSITIQ